MYTVRNRQSHGLSIAFRIVLFSLAVTVCFHLSLIRGHLRPSAATHDAVPMPHKPSPAATEIPDGNCRLEREGLLIALKGIRMAPEDLSYPKDFLGFEDLILPSLNNLLADPAACGPWTRDLIGLLKSGCDPARFLSRILWNSDGIPAVQGDGAMPSSMPPEAQGLEGHWAEMLEPLRFALSETAQICQEVKGRKKLVLRACASVLSGQEKAQEKFLEKISGALKEIASDDIFRAGFRLYDRMIRTVHAFEAMNIKALPSSRQDFENEACRASGGILHMEQHPNGMIIVGGPGTNRYEGRFLLIIDTGGDDVYRMAEGRPGGVSAVMDLAGNDSYEGGNYALASGLFGVGILIDCSGDDVYRGGNFSCGCGIAGMGLLEDLAGHDAYHGGCVSQGAGAFRGAGFLFDRAGHDAYQVDLYGQGYGAALGAGLLWEGGGSDQYRAGGRYRDVRERRRYFRSQSQGCGMGFRPAVPGGAGVLFDLAGDDAYEGDYFVQGTGSWYGLGLLLDLAGNDCYRARRYAQGAGVHVSTGILVDQSGDDDYRAWGVSQGTGHDLAVGFFRDGDGDDVIESDWLSRGAGSANGVGIFLEMAGADTYNGEERECNGAGRKQRSFGSVGLFMDFGGDDLYGKVGRNRGSWLQSEYGIGIDIEKSGDFD